MMRVVVVGAGVIGAAVAYQLARAGAQVLVASGAAPNATSASFGWINASFYLDDAHQRFRDAGIDAFGRLLADDPTLPICFSGALCWEDQGKALHETAERLRRLDYSVEVIDRGRFATLEPDLNNVPDEALLFQSEGWADAHDLAATLLTKQNVQHIDGVIVREVLTHNGQAVGVQTDTGTIDADHVVVCAGMGSSALLEPLGIHLPMLKRPGVSVVTEPVAAQLNHILVTPAGEVRQLPDGRLLSPAAASHQGDSAEEILEPLDVIADRTAARLAGLVAAPGLSWESVSVAHRPVPLDGLPVIGKTPVEGMHVAVMHSGVTLAAITGEILAAQIMGQLTNAQTQLIADYGIDRFQS